MKVLVVTDIFGRTDAVEKLARELSTGTEIIDPYDGQWIRFNDEQQAYHYFRTHTGIERYSKHLQQQILKHSGKVKLIGFSVGAAAIWNISEQFSPELVTDAICFYGSQIRHSMTIKPIFPVELILPKSEAHFSVSEMSEQLRNTDNVCIQSTQYLHGFMNPYSQNYDHVAYQHYLNSLSVRYD